MNTLANHAGSGGYCRCRRLRCDRGTALSCAALIVLHVVSPEFAPSWRMVSEYANGGYPWLLLLVFPAGR